MLRSRFASGLLTTLMGCALLFPVGIAWLERDELTGVGIGVVAAGCGLTVIGLAVASLSIRQRAGSDMPSGVRAVVAANTLILAFLALELSDRLVRQDGNVIYWTTFLLLPALLLFRGLVAARSWAWWISRAVAALGVLWFLGFIAVIPFANLQADGVPTPWYGRVYMACVTFAFATIMAGAFWSLGRPETRCYFGLIRPAEQAEG